MPPHTTPISTFLAKNQMDSRLEQKTTRVQTLDSILEARSCPNGFRCPCRGREGFEECVFRSFDLKRWRPRLMIVELSDVHEELNVTAELADFPARRVRFSHPCRGISGMYRTHQHDLCGRTECAVIQPLNASRRSAA